MRTPKAKSLAARRIAFASLVEKRKGRLEVQAALGIGRSTYFRMLDDLRSAKESAACAST